MLGETVIEFDSLKQNEDGGNVRGQGSRKGNQADNEWRGQQVSLCYLCHNLVQFALL